MRRLLLVLLCLFSVESTGYCARLYLVAAGDVKHRAIGRMVENTQEYLAATFNSMPKENVEVIYPSKNYPSSTAGKALLSTLEHLNINKGDSIFVFYLGHGGYALESHTHWLKYDDGDLARSDIENALRRHRDKAQVCALITDACAMLMKDRGARGTEDREILPGLNGIPEGWKRLFFHSCGMANINSCEWGEVAAANYKREDGTISDKSSFSQAFVELLVKHRDSTEITWSQLFEEVQVETNRRFQKTFPDGREYLAPNGEKHKLIQQMPRKTGSLPQEIGKAAPSGKKRVGAQFEEGDQGAVFLRYTDDNSPAKKMKLADRADEPTVYSLVPGDVILEVDGQPVKDLEELAEALRTASLKMELNVKRGDTQTKYLIFPREVDQTGEIERD